MDIHFPNQAEKNVKANNLIESSMTPKILIICLTFSVGKIILNKSFWLVIMSIEIITSTSIRASLRYIFALLNNIISSLYLEIINTPNIKLKTIIMNQAQ